VNVDLKDATAYAVRDPPHSVGRQRLFTVDATLTTNVHGNGEAIAVDAIDRRAKAVNVIVDTGKKFEKSTYRAPDKYALVRGSGTPSARAHPSRFSGHGK
jgi:hypothetical protein